VSELGEQLWTNVWRGFCGQEPIRDERWYDRTFGLAATSEISFTVKTHSELLFAAPEFGAFFDLTDPDSFGVEFAWDEFVKEVEDNVG
jgi:hypothetical protein